MLEVTVQDIGALMGGAGTLYAAVKGMPMLSNFLKNQVRLVHERNAMAVERDAAVENAKRATDAADAFELAAKGWRAAIDSIGAEVLALRAEIEASRRDVQASREELHESREELRRTRELLAEAIIYITNIHTFMRLGGAPPEMSVNLRSELTAILAERSIAESKEHLPSNQPPTLQPSERTSS